MRQYELLVMFEPSANEISVEKKITEKCKKYNLKVIGLDKWGSKVLAYPIDKHTKAIYLVYTLEGETVADMERDLQLDESVMRWLLIRV